jgi:hypothetical protein
MDKKKIIKIGGVIVILLIVGGGIFVLSSKKPEISQQITVQDQTVQTLLPKDIGLKLTTINGNKKVKVIVEKVSDIKSLEYDIIYDADIPESELATGEQGGKVERGFNDQTIIKTSDTKYESKEYILGSCSKNVCRYDTGVTSVSILMKVTKRDGNVYQVKDAIKL